MPNKKLTELKAELLRNGSETMRKLLDDNLFTERAFENIISEMLKQYGKAVVKDATEKLIAYLEDAGLSKRDAKADATDLFKSQLDK